MSGSVRTSFGRVSHAWMTRMVILTFIALAIQVCPTPPFSSVAVIADQPYLSSVCPWGGIDNCPPSPSSVLLSVSTPHTCLFLLFLPFSFLSSRTLASLPTNWRVVPRRHCPFDPFFPSYFARVVCFNCIEIPEFISRSWRVNTSIGRATRSVTRPWAHASHPKESVSLGSEGESL
jgi:hypothetical protein